MHELKGMAYTLYRHINEPRFLTNLSHENIYAVNIFMRLNEFSSVRLIYIVRTCLKGLYAMPTVKHNEYTFTMHSFSTINQNLQLNTKFLGIFHHSMYSYRLIPYFACHKIFLWHLKWCFNFQRISLHIAKSRIIFFTA